MPDGKQSHDPQTRIALLERENQSLREMYDSLKQRLANIEQQQGADHVKLAEFESATRTGKWVLGLLATIGTLAIGIIAIVVARGGQP